VRAQQHVGLLNVLLALRTFGIARNPWIDVQGLPFWRLDAKCGVAQPRQLDSLKIHDTPRL